MGYDWEELMCQWDVMLGMTEGVDSWRLWDGGCRYGRAVQMCPT